MRHHALYTVKYEPGAELGIIGRRKRIFLELVELLRAIEADRDDIDLLKRLNGAIIRAVIKTEQDVVRLKAKARTLNKSLRTQRQSKQSSLMLRRRIKSSYTRAENYSKQLWLWRLFGDAVAHLYLDKFAIKHTFFETESYDVKPAAGMMHGKSGLLGEASVLLEALSHDVPAILCDCTNVLRYGDVCLLGNSDPYIIEAKSTERLNQRGKRQAANLHKLQQFLETDVATDFRGNPGEVRRQAIETPELVHVDLLNACIDAAGLHGGKIVSPERGLNYVAMYTDCKLVDVSEMVMEEGLNIYCRWNDAKTLGYWVYYVPFLLTIRDPDRLYDFIEGRLVVMIYMNGDVLASHMKGNGWKALFLQDGAYAVLCQHIETGGVMALSRQMANRVFYDCTSLEWMGKSQIQAMEHSWELAKGSIGPNFAFDQREYVERNFGISYDTLMVEFDKA